MRFSNKTLERMAAEHRRNASEAGRMRWPVHKPEEYQQRQTDLTEMIEELLDWRMRHFVSDRAEGGRNGKPGKVAPVL